MSRIPLLAAVLATVLALSACASDGPDDAAPDTGADDTTASANRSGTKAERAAAAGLSDAQVAALDSLEVPVYVPDLPDGWTLTGATTERLVSDGTDYPGYELHYRTAAQTCLHLLAVSEGIGGVFMADPPNERNVALPGVPADGPALLGWGAADDTTESWEGGRVATEWVQAGRLFLSLQSPDEADPCGPASPQDAEAFLVALRPLNPDDDARN